MVRSKLFWKLFFMYAMLTTSSLVVVTWFDLAGRERALLEHHDQKLRSVAEILRDQLRADWAELADPEWQQRLSRLGKKTAIRITVVDIAGNVLADSQQAPQLVAAALGRAEFAEAMQTGEGRDQRANGTGEPMRYLTLRVDRDGEPLGFVRTAENVADVNARRFEQRRLSIVLALLVNAIALFGTYIAVRDILKPLARLTEAAHQVARGRDVAPISVDRGSELMPLADAFNHMNREIRHREDEFRDAANLLSTVLGGMTEGVLAVDRSRVLLFANAAAGRFLKFDSRISQGKPVTEVVRNGSLLRLVEETLRQEQPADDGTTEIHVDGVPVRILAVNVARLPGTPCPGIILVLHDVSDVRGLEEMRQQFIANVSHELKTPLSSIKVHAETLMAGAVDDPEVNRRFLAEIEEQAERLHQLILDMLQLARIESGRQGLEIEPIDVSEVILEAVHHHRSSAEKKQIVVSVEGDDDQLQVLADHEGIQQIVDNLLDNAIKYSPEGSHVWVRWRGDATMVCIAFQDEGPGIKPEDQERVFERFFRVDKARSRELGSTGLGLSIVKHLARALGGEVTLRSEYGAGSTFTIRLPRAR